jgi:hypothetical protein
MLAPAAVDGGGARFVKGACSGSAGQEWQDDGEQRDRQRQKLLPGDDDDPHDDCFACVCPGLLQTGFLELDWTLLWLREAQVAPASYGGLAATCFPSR